MIREFEEILEAIWMCEEQNKNRIDEIREICHVQIEEGVLENMQKEELVAFDGTDIYMTGKGKEIAKGLIRRKRLGEILLEHVLDIKGDRADKIVKPSEFKILVAMPAYNEDKYIGSLVLKARQYADEVLVENDLLLFCFDPTHARSIGINTGFLHYLLLSVLSLAAVAGLQTVGIILVVAMLVTPGATAYLLTDRFDRMSWLAIGSSILSSLLGVYTSYWTDSSTAGCIVLVQTGLFVIAFLFAPRHGILRHRFASSLPISTLPKR